MSRLAVSTGRLCVVVFAGLMMFMPAIASAVESIHFQYQESYPTQTDAVRLSTRIGYTWFSSNVKKCNSTRSPDRRVTRMLRFR
jgi:hypothetical protein